MEDSATAADRFPRCTYLGCSQPATHGVERAYLGTPLYCREHMEEMAPQELCQDPAASLRADRASHKSTSQPGQ